MAETEFFTLRNEEEHIILFFNIHTNNQVTRDTVITAVIEYYFVGYKNDNTI